MSADVRSSRGGKCGAVGGVSANLKGGKVGAVGAVSADFGSVREREMGSGGWSSQPSVQDKVFRLLAETPQIAPSTRPERVRAFRVAPRRSVRHCFFRGCGRLG